MIVISDFDVGIIPQLLIYFIPGYIGILTFRALANRSLKSESLIWVSCVVSYLITTFVKVLWPSNIAMIPELLALVTCIVSCGIAAFLAKASEWKWVSRLIVGLFHVNIAPTVFAAHADLINPGTTIRLYLKDDNICVEGGLSNYGTSSDDSYISLKYYSFRRFDEEEPYYQCMQDDHYFVIKFDNVKYIEMRPRQPKV